MTDLVLARARRRRNGFFRPLRELFDGLRLACAMAHRYDVLSRLSDAALAKRGLKREDIPRAVVNGKYDL
jgi:hypothetical protein